MNNIIELVLALTIASAALAFGAVEPTAALLIEGVIFILVLLVIVRQTLQGKIDLPMPVWPVLFVALILLEILPVPPGILEHLEPRRLLDPQLLAVLGARQGWMSISVDPHETTLALTRFLAYLGTFVLSAWFFQSGKRGSILLRVLILLGCFEAAVGIIQYLAGWQKIFTFTKVVNVDRATGTYINDNHFAGLLELTFPFIVGMIFYAVQNWSQSRGSGLSRRTSEGSGASGFQAIFYSFLLVVVFVAIVFSRSRGGILSSILTLIFVGVVGQLRAKRKGWILLIVFALTAILGYALWIGLDPVLARFEQMRGGQFLRIEARVGIWNDTLRLIEQYPLTGTGLGTFMIVFRRFQTGMLGFLVDHAHNDYLEFASDTGLPGAALLFVPIFYLLVKMFLAFLDEPGRYRRSVLLGCMGSTLALLMHSMTDFNLQIPANALIFAAVLGIGYKAACIEPRGQPESHRGL